jgi:Domain of unknown function (DUF303).
MKLKLITLASLFVFISMFAVVSAQVKLAPLFSDHMVLQQKSDVPIWGTASPSQEIVIMTSWNKRTYKTKSDKDGKWIQEVRTPKAGGPYYISISNGVSVKLDDVLIGEVWLCSGQSNMSMPVKGWGKVNDFEEVIRNCSNNKIRLLQVNQNTSPEKIKDFTVLGDNGWQICSPSILEEFSAIAYFFGKDINKYLNVPVGLINSSWGGTILEAWTSIESLRDMRGRDDAFKQLKDYQDKCKDGNIDSSNPNIFSVLFNAMINPLIPYKIKGALWYQGESHVGQPILYRDILPNLISDWRNLWGYDFPFHVVQLANYINSKENEDTGWAGIREAQDFSSRNVKDVGLAVTIDIGDPNDIHPKNKQEAGRRLALVARAQTYGQNVVCSGPQFDSYKIEGDKIRLSFMNVKKGFVIKDGDIIKGFTISGIDHTFHKADAVIDGKTILVSSTEVKQPLAVRFAWSDNPEINLYNKEGLPCSSFRTDNWFD